MSEAIYSSNYTPNQVTAAQYLAEIACERQAKYNKDELCHKFWNTEKWKRTFLMQVRFAHNLFKVYGEKVVIRAYTCKEAQNVYSLGAKWFVPIIKQIALKIEQEEKQPIKIIAVAQSDKVRPAFPSKSTLDKLDG